MLFSEFGKYPMFSPMDIKDGNLVEFMEITHHYNEIMDDMDFLFDINNDVDDFFNSYENNELRKKLGNNK